MTPPLMVHQMEIYGKHRGVREHTFHKAADVSAAASYDELAPPQTLLSYGLFGRGGGGGGQHEQVRLGRDGSISMNRAPSSVAGRV